MKKIKRRDGTMVEVDDAYVIQDGESFTIPIMMMDSIMRITDSRGNPAGQRPGFLYADSDTALAVTETVHAEYRDMISNRWRSDRWQTPKSAPRGTGSPVSTGSPVEDAYRTYARDISERWKR